MAVLLGARVPEPAFDALPLKCCGASDAELPELFERQSALVKTVRDSDWLELIRKLRAPDAFRTSVTLPPKGALGMRLFGERRTSCAGLVWDRAQLDLSEAYIWPSGYMAKTEFNLNHKGELVNGRSSALVTINHLVECNRRRLTTNADTGALEEVGDGAMSFNEINWPCRGSEGIVAVFVRSMELGHVLHALGVSALLQHALGLDLPLLLLDSENPVSLLNKSILEISLRAFREVPPKETWPMVSVPRLPISLKEMHFSELEMLELHAMYGLTGSTLRQLFLSVSVERFYELLSIGVAQCVARCNVPSARELIRSTAPVLLSFDNSAAVLRCEQRLLAEALEHCEALEDSNEELRTVLGAQVMLVEFRSGQTKQRIDRAVQELGEWLRKVNSQCTVCDIFSWVETWRKERTSRVSSFISGRAISNRADFLKHLKKLRDAEDGDTYVRELYEVVQALRSPCLRFHILRDVLGLDFRFSRNVLHAIVCFAFDIFVPRALSAFEVDEATRLEAEEAGGCALARRPSREILGVETPDSFSSDPLGLETRLYRALYRENRSRKFS